MAKPANLSSYNPLLHRRLSFIPLLCALLVTALTPTLAWADFTGEYALSNFTLTNANDPVTVLPPANGFAEVTPAGSLMLTGSNTGSGLPASTDLTIASRGTGTVSFAWSWSSLDDPAFDVGGYLVNGVFIVLADTNGTSGSTMFPVSLGQVFGFSVHTVDNQFEPGILTISNFSAPLAAAAVPEPGTFGLIFSGGLAGTALRRYLHAGGKQ